MKKKGFILGLDMVTSVIFVAIIIVVSLLLFTDFGPKIVQWASELTSGIRDSFLTFFS